MAARDRVGVELPTKVKAAAERVAKRRGLKTAGLLRSYVVERLLADGDITDADLEDDTDTKEAT